MASPVDAGRSPTVISTATTPLVFNLPASIAAGETLILFIRLPTAITLTTPTGWTALISANTADASDDNTYVYWRKADGAEGATVSITPSGSSKAAGIAWRITGAADPTTRAPEAGAVVVTTTTANTCNPGAVTPTGGSKDYLFLALAGADGELIFGTQPTNYVNLTTADSGAAGATASNCFIGGSSRQLTASTEDPGVYTHGAANAGTTGITVAVHPAGPAATSLVFPSRLRQRHPLLRR